MIHVIVSRSSIGSNHSLYLDLSSAHQCGWTILGPWNISWNRNWVLMKSRRWAAQTCANLRRSADQQQIIIDLCVVSVTTAQCITGHPELPQGGSQHSRHPSWTAVLFEHTKVPWSCAQCPRSVARGHHEGRYNTFRRSQAAGASSNSYHCCARRYWYTGRVSEVSCPSAPSYCISMAWWGKNEKTWNPHQVCPASLQELQTKSPSPRQWRALGISQGLAWYFGQACEDTQCKRFVVVGGWIQQTATTQGGPAWWSPCTTDTAWWRDDWESKHPAEWVCWSSPTKQDQDGTYCQDSPLWWFGPGSKCQGHSSCTRKVGSTSCCKHSHQLDAGLR